jgi:predicted nucleic acid-binding protein
LPLYGKHVIGRRITVAQQTVAEVRYGAIAAGWGERRLDAVERLLRRSRVLSVDDHTSWTYARLRHECRTLDHPLHQKQHRGDLWIAATASRPLADPACRSRHRLPGLSGPAAHRTRRQLIRTP